MLAGYAETKAPRWSIWTSFPGSKVVLPRGLPRNMSPGYRQFIVGRCHRRNGASDGNTFHFYRFF